MLSERKHALEPSETFARLFASDKRAKVLMKPLRFRRPVLIKVNIMLKKWLHKVLPGKNAKTRAHKDVLDFSEHGIRADMLSFAAGKSGAPPAS